MIVLPVPALEPALAAPFPPPTQPCRFPVGANCGKLSSPLIHSCSSSRALTKATLTQETIETYSCSRSPPQGDLHAHPSMAHTHENAPVSLSFRLLFSVCPAAKYKNTRPHAQLSQPLMPFMLFRARSCWGFSSLLASAVCYDCATQTTFQNLSTPFQAFSGVF